MIAIGSNAILAEMNLDTALDELAARNITLAQSTRRLWTEPIMPDGAIGIGSPFLNGLIVVDTTLDFATLNATLKDIEQKLGSTKAKKRGGKVVVDLDILSYDGERHHLDDWQRNYIQTLIQEL